MLASMLSDYSKYIQCLFALDNDLGGTECPELKNYDINECLNLMSKKGYIMCDHGHNTYNALRYQ